MASLNQWALKQQKRTLLASLFVLVIAVGGCILLVGKKAKPVQTEQSINLTGIIDESFTKANAESALSVQQVELETLKQQMRELKEIMQKREEDESETLSTRIAEKLKEVKETVSQAALPVNNAPSERTATYPGISIPKLHTLYFNYKRHQLDQPKNHFNPDRYVPSGTFVRAVVLGGADADASVNGQSKNNGVMLFKLLQPGTLPNGQHSRLQGCFVTASSYGDISSERAYVVLDRLSCAVPGRPFIDKAVTGWAFFGG